MCLICLNIDMFTCRLLHKSALYWLEKFIELFLCCVCVSDLKSRREFVLLWLYLVFRCLIFRNYCVVFQRILFAKIFFNQLMWHMSRWIIHSRRVGCWEGVLLSGRRWVPHRRNFRNIIFLMSIFRTEKVSMYFPMMRGDQGKHTLTISRPIKFCWYAMFDISCL